MSEQTPNTQQPHDEIEPFIPPQYMLYLAAVGLIVAGITAFTQPEFTVVGWGGLGLALLSLLAWGLMDPASAKAVLTGRTVRVGGTTLVISVIVLVAMTAIYTVVKQQNWRFDLTQADNFSLTDTAREEIAKLGADPTRPDIRIYAFYGVGQAGRRDRDVVLLDDYATASAGKIGYEFIDPDRNPALAEKFDNPRAGQLKVAALDENGEPNLEDAETLSFFSQEEMTNAILRVSSSGDFRAYFLNVQNGLQLSDTGSDGLSGLKDNLERLKWTAQQLTLFELTSPESEYKLDDPTDGTVLVIPGGDSPLPDDQLKIITDYLDNGGNVLILASFAINTAPLAAADNLSAYLYDNFGLRVNNDVVVDRSASSGSPLTPVAADFDRAHFITSRFAQGSVMLFDLTHSIDINPETPPDVKVTTLVRSTSNSYAKTDFTPLTTTGDMSKTEGDVEGPFVLAAAAENSRTGARVVVFGSQFVATNRYDQLSALGVENLNAVFLGTAWAASFDSFVSEIPQVGLDVRAQDAPIFAQDQDLRTINLITIILLPFGILAIGLFVWFNGRERVKEEA